MKLKLYVTGLALSVLTIGYGTSINSLPYDEKTSKTIDTIKGYFETNENNQTYGTYIDTGNSEYEEPDLMAVVGVNNVDGYVRKVDLYDEKNQPNNPKEAIAYNQKRQKEGPRLVPVYEKYGKTVIGEYRID